MNPELTAIGIAEIDSVLARIKEHTADWLQSRRVPDTPFGHFSFSERAYADDELNAATGALELWVMLGLPLKEEQRREAVAHLRSYQDPDTGLVRDPTWKGRQRRENRHQLEKGDTFFTMTAACALEALGSTFLHPVAYLKELDGDTLAAQINLLGGAHSPFVMGDCAPLVRLNERLGIPSAAGQWRALMDMLEEKQDPLTGLWSDGKVSPPYTPYINRAFHFMRTTWNVVNHPYRFPERIIDTCLAAAWDPDYYSWERGFACNDLDLALMLYSSSRWTSHRCDDVAEWALKRLPSIIGVQKPDGGFSFRHESAMTEHAGIAMSPGEPEGDMWGTLMYLVTVKMMVELGYDGKTAPWSFNQVHAVPKANRPQLDCSSVVGRGPHW